MVVGGSNDDYFSTGAKLAQRDQDRDKSRREANYRVAEGPVFSPAKDYMRTVGREGIKRQQESMRDTAADETARIPRRMSVKRTPPKAAAKRK